MLAGPDVFRQTQPEMVQGIALIQCQHTASRQPEAFATTEGGFTGKQRLEVNTASAVVIEDKFLIAKL